MIAPELAAAIDALVTAILAKSYTSWPAEAVDNPRALLAHATDALFAYYVGTDGTVYELDLDRWPRYEPVDNDAKVREAYAALAAKYPQLPIRL